MVEYTSHNDVTKCRPINTNLSQSVITLSEGLAKFALLALLFVRLLRKPLIEQHEAAHGQLLKIVGKHQIFVVSWFYAYAGTPNDSRSTSTRAASLSFCTTCTPHAATATMDVVSSSHDRQSEAQVETDVLARRSSSSFLVTHCLANGSLAIGFTRAYRAIPLLTHKAGCAK